MFRKLFQRNKSPKFITVVSGLPRSGTSMMMKMLEAGGIPPIQDGIRSADEDNPKGYYEFERVKQLDKGDTAWLPDCIGKSVKVISALLVHLPEGYEYRVLFMRRNLDEVLRSQEKMLVRRDEDKSAEDDAMKLLYRKHLRQVDGWMRRHDNVKVLDVQYGDLVRNPAGQMPQIVQFLGGTLDLNAMVAIADPKLYRNRK